MKYLFGDFAGIVPQNVTYSLKRYQQVRTSRLQMLLDCGDQLIRAGGLNKVIVDLAANRLQRGLKRREAGKYQRDARWLSATHCTHHGESIARVSNVEIRDENVKVLPGDFLDCFTHATRTGYV